MRKKILTEEEQKKKPTHVSNGNDINAMHDKADSTEWSQNKI